MMTMRMNGRSDPFDLESLGENGNAVQSCFPLSVKKEDVMIPRYPLHENSTTCSNGRLYVMTFKFKVRLCE